jgi:hypothetical protein
LWDRPSDAVALRRRRRAGRVFTGCSPST